jgi:pilus assembly protein CpaE
MSAAPIRATVALGPAVDRGAVEAACAGQPGLALAAFVDAGPGALPVLAGSADDALVIACRDESDEMLRFIRAAAEQRPQRPVVVLFEGTANGFVRRVIDAGADDLVNGARLEAGSPAGAEVAFALEKALARRDGAAHHAGGAESQVVTVLGPKGGTGKTLTSCNLAVALAVGGRKVALVDLDLQFGDVGLALGLTPERTLYELAVSGGSMDAEKLEDYLAVHASGLRVMLAPRRPDQAGAVQVGFLRDLLTALREMFDVVVIDTPPAFSPEVITAIDLSDSVCVVAMLDALSLKNTRLALETLELMKVPSERLHVVLNRADSRVGVTPQDATHLLGREPDVLVPSHRDVTRSVNEASPIVTAAKGSEAAQAFFALAEVFTPVEAGERGARAQHGGRRRLRIGRGS